MLRHFNRFGLLEAFVALVTALFLLLTLIDYYQTMHAGRVQAEAVLAQTERTVTVEVQQLVTAAGTLLLQLDAGHRTGVVDLLDARSVQHLVLPVLRQHQSLSGFKCFHADGNGQALLRTPDGWHNLLYRGTQPGVATLVTLNRDGEEVARHMLQDRYDGRQRPWYKAARPGGAISWSPPYVQRATHALGLTAAKALHRGDGVIGVTIELKDLSSFLARCSSHWSGAKVVIADMQGKVLASSDADLRERRLAGLTVPSLASPGFETELRAVQETATAGTPFHRLQGGREIVFSRVSETEVAPGSSIRIILTVPSSVFTGSFATDLAWKTMVYLILLISASLLYLRRYIFPLRNLVRLMEECTFPQPRRFAADTRLDEVGLLYRHLSQMTSKLVNARDYLENVLNAVGDPIIVKDAEGRFVLVNDAACALFGHCRDQLIGRNDHEIFPSDQAEVFCKIDLMVLDSGESNQNEETLTGADGEPRTIVTRKTRYLDHCGKRFVVAVIRDITELREAQGKVVENARQAGMAEIAVNVLHNVGNVLNSVTVSAGLVMQMARGSKAPGLARAADMLVANAGRLGAFLEEDKKGRMMPAYLRKLGETLKEEQATIVEELERLHKNVEHIGDVIATQQRYAGASGIVQPIQVRDLLEDALHINQEAITLHGVTVLRDIPEVPHLPLDKARILLILVNLIKNAVHALARGNDPFSRKLQLKVESLPEQGEPILRITVADNGEGIAAENLTRIFAHGFTTKGKGHGFGLHGCALAAQEMGGSLSASSAGAGKGSAFLLEVPVGVA